MAAPESVDSGANQSLYVSLRSFWGVLVAILYTRLDLATLELEEEATRAVQLVAVIMGALLCIGITLFFIMFFLVVAFWNQALIVLGIICAVGIIGCAVLVFIAQKMIVKRPKFLSHTLAELKRDIEGLKPASKPSEPSV
jgi:uncharacterized membrane protein YqjE